MYLKSDDTLWHYRGMTEPEYLTPEQVAEKLQMNPGVVRRMLAAGKLPGRRVGRIWRVPSDELRKFMSAGDKKDLSRPE
jgi:excisionase family DNA binding protein